MKHEHTSVENISPITIHGTGPKPIEKAEIYVAIRTNGNHPTLVMDSLFVSFIKKKIDRPMKHKHINIDEMVNNIRRPVLSTIAIVINVIIS